MPNDLTIRPRAMQIEASSICQLRCPECPTTSGAIHPAVGSGFLRPDDLRALLEANPDIRQVELSNYGEIFLNPHLLDIMRICDERGIAITANNGVNLNHASPEMLEAVVRHRVRVLSVSIDGATQETYEHYRVKGRLDAVIANIVRLNGWKRRLRSEFPHLRWQFVVFGHNEHEIEDAKAQAESLGMVFVPKLSWDDRVSPVRDADAVRRVVHGEAATREEYRERTGQDYVAGICHQLWDSPQVNWDGKMLGCCRNFWGDFDANVFRDGFVNAVNSERMILARAMLRGEAEPRDDIPCTTCDIFHNMRRDGSYLRRRDVARGQGVGVAEALTIATELRGQGQIAEASRMCRSILAVEPSHTGALLLLYEMDRATSPASPATSPSR
jgi:MoaA/NifB/PqqE/SkfB family radical SAM enzyme